MYLVFENVHPNAIRVFKDLSEQQLQAITDTEDYTLIKVEAIISPDHSPKAVAYLIMEDQSEELVQGGVFGQDGNVVQVR